MTARPRPPNPPFLRRDDKEEEEKEGMFEGEASSGWALTAWQQGS